MSERDHEFSRSFSTTCKYCYSPIELDRFATRCPVCDEVLLPRGMGERRAAPTVPFVRDWITSLRFAGADFDKRAARAAGEFAAAGVDRGLLPTELFELARAAYYRALDGNGDGPTHGTDTSSNGRSLGARPAAQPEPRPGIADTA